MINRISQIIHWIKWRCSSDTNRPNIARKMGVKIGNNCRIFGDVQFGSEPYLIKIGNNVRITSNVKFVTHDGGLWVIRNLYKKHDIDKFGSIVIGNNVHIGWNVVIMPGVEIGNNCVIGVGAVVTNDIPDNSVAVGVPAKVIESIDQYYEKSLEKIVNTHKMNRIEKREFLEKFFGAKNEDMFLDTESVYFRRRTNCGK